MVQVLIALICFLCNFGISTFSASIQQVDSVLNPISVTVNGGKEAFYYIKLDHRGNLDDSDVIDWCRSERIAANEHETVLAAAKRQFEDLTEADRLRLIIERFQYMGGIYTGETKSVDLGCGSKNPRNPFNASTVFGIDIRDDADSGIYKADLVTEPIPFANSTFHYVTAYDVLEHIPRLIYAPGRRYAFVELMNEIYRVMKFGGKPSGLAVFNHVSVTLYPK